MDSALRNSLWNVFQLSVWKSANPNYTLLDSNNRRTQRLCMSLWIELYKVPVDTIPEYVSSVHKLIKESFFGVAWYEVYDFIEHVAKNAFEYEQDRRAFTALCNSVLERERSGYRFVGLQIAPIIDSAEVAAVEEAGSSSLLGVRAHIQRALELLSDRENPDFRNSIKESISAVESACKTIAGNGSADLAAALQVVNSRHPMHAAFREALKRLYGYTSDEDGIRHGIMDESAVDFADAKFMLVACAAFCNFLLMRSK